MKVKDLYNKKAVQYVTFDGCYESALNIHYELASNDFIDCNLDIGGLNVAYVDESVSGDHLSAAVEQCLWGCFYNTG